MTPDNVTPCATAVMAVVLNGKEHRITVEPGRNGRQQFEKEIRRLFSLSSDDELEFTFDCQTPGEGVLSSATFQIAWMPGRIVAACKRQAGFNMAVAGNCKSVWLSATVLSAQCAYNMSSMVQARCSLRHCQRGARTCLLMHLAIPDSVCSV